MTEIEPVPNPLANFEIGLIAIPQADDVLILPDADRTTTDFIVASRIFLVLVITICRLWSITTFVKLVTDDSKHEVFPQSICDALSQANDPFSTREIQRVFPYWSADTGVKE